MHIIGGTYLVTVITERLLIFWESANELCYDLNAHNI